MDNKNEIVTRLRRIEGQVRGLTRMVEEEKGCEEILTQLLAVRAALDQAAVRLIDLYMEQCLPEEPSAEQLRAARGHLRRAVELLLRM
ncbi:MAG: metal-sensitive transcriptional regulator [Chloroflexia bacterium]